MILHLGFDVCIEANKVRKHIAQLCMSQAKKASRSICGVLVADSNEQDCEAGPCTVLSLR